MGVRVKAPDTLQNKWGGRHKALQAPTNGHRLSPECPEGLHPKAAEAWATLWGSSLAGAFHETDVFGISRWAWYLSEWFKATSLPGDRRYVISIEKAIREFERFYGLDPLSRVRLGLTLVDQAKAAEGLKEPQGMKKIA
jgi:hypothetical protein